MTEDVGEFHFCMEKALMDQVGAVFIDYDPTGRFPYLYGKASVHLHHGRRELFPVKSSPAFSPPREAAVSRPFGAGMFLSARRVSAFI